MIQRSIGDVPVGAIGLGGASFTFDALAELRVEEAVDAALAAGITYFDTAAAYTHADESTHNERLLRRALHGRDAIIGTKGGHYRDCDDFPIDGSRARIRSQVDQSLTALGVDALDLYFLHWPDPLVPTDDSVGFIDELRTEGRVNQGIAYLVYSPLGGAAAPHRLADWMPRSTARANELRISIQRLVLAWELQVGATVIPIAGATRPATVADSAAAADTVLDPEMLAILEKELS